MRFGKDNKYDPVVDAALVTQVETIEVVGFGNPFSLQEKLNRAAKESEVMEWAL